MPNATAVLSEEEKMRIRHHLGYLLTDPVSSIQLGFPRASQPGFLVEAAMNRIPVPAVGLIRRYIAIMDNIEDLLVDAQTRFAAEKLGEITLNQAEPDKLEREYARWAMRLADDLGCPLNAYAHRFRAGQGPALMLPRLH